MRIKGLIVILLIGIMVVGCGVSEKEVDVAYIYEHGEEIQKRIEDNGWYIVRTALHRDNGLIEEIIDLDTFVNGIWFTYEYRISGPRVYRKRYMIEFVLSEQGLEKILFNSTLQPVDRTEDEVDNLDKDEKISYEQHMERLDIALQEIGLTKEELQCWMDWYQMNKERQ